MGCAQSTLEGSSDSVAERPSQEGSLQEADAQQVAKEDQGLDEEIAKILAKRERVKSLTYTYYDSEQGAQGDHYAVLGSKIRVDNFIPQNYHKEDLHTVVFIDRELGIQVGYCRDESRCKDIDPNKKVTPFKNYDRRTPFDWANLIKNGKIVNTQTIDGRNTINIETTIDGVPTLMWIDTYYGIPMKVQQGDFVITFDEIAFNTVKPEEVTP